MPNSKQHTIAGLIACGWGETTIRSKKYTAYVKPGEQVTLLVGKSGALRLIKHGEPISSSISITGGRWHIALQAVGRVAKSLTSVEQAQRMLEANL